MDTGLLVQYLIIAVAVLVSAWVVLKKQFPGTVRTLRGAGAGPAEAGPRGLGAGAGAEDRATGNGSGGACGGCDSCGPTKK